MLCIFPGRCTGDVPGCLVVVDVVDHDEVLAGILLTKLPDHYNRFWRATVLLHFCDEAVDFRVRKGASGRGVPSKPIDGTAATDARLQRVGYFEVVAVVAEGLRPSWNGEDNQENRYGDADEQAVWLVREFTCS